MVLDQSIKNWILLWIRGGRGVSRFLTANQVQVRNGSAAHFTNYVNFVPWSSGYSVCLALHGMLVQMMDRFHQT